LDAVGFQVNLRFMKPDFPVLDGAVQIDASQWPILIIRHDDKTNTEEQNLEFLKVFSEFVKSNKERYALVADLASAENTKSNDRRLLSKSMSQNKELNKKYRACAAIVFDSAVTRGALMALTWIFKPPYPTQTFKTVDDAIAWAKEQL